jgi:hypothetical protein
MPDISGVEHQENEAAVLREYESLASKYPLESLSQIKSEKRPDYIYHITEADQRWAESYLNLGSNGQVIKNFGESLDQIGERGIYLLREQSAQQRRSVFEALEVNVTQDLFLGFLRIKFQEDFLYYEQRSRISRNLDDWHGVDMTDSLVTTRDQLKRTKAAMIELYKFSRGEIKELKDAKAWLNIQFYFEKGLAEMNQGILKDRPQDTTGKRAKEILERDDKRLIVFTTLSGFVENLELSRNENQGK